MVVGVCACVSVCTCGCACLRGMFGNTIQRLRGQAYVDYVLILAQRNDWKVYSTNAQANTHANTHSHTRMPEQPCTAHAAQPSSYAPHHTRTKHKHTPYIHTHTSNTYLRKFFWVHQEFVWPTSCAPHRNAPAHMTLCIHTTHTYINIQHTPAQILWVHQDIAWPASCAPHHEAPAHTTPS